LRQDAVTLDYLRLAAAVLRVLVVPG